MKNLLAIILVSLFLCSCASHRTHEVSHDPALKRSYEYCKGGLWGYMMPIGPRQDKPWWNRSFHDPKPLLATFLMLHSALEPSPLDALNFNFIIHANEDMSVQMTDQTLKVRIDDMKEVKIKMDLVFTEQVKLPDELYPYPRYNISLIDSATNKWRVAKLNRWFYLLEDSVEEIILPNSKHHKLDTKTLSVVLDKKIYDDLYLSASTNIWPKGLAFKNSKIEITTPAFVLNGTTYESRQFTFYMNYEKVKKAYEDQSRMICPSTHRIFLYND